MNRSILLLAGAALLFLVTPAWAITLPVLEDFDTNTANWRQNSKALDVNFVATGGPNGAGDSYVSYDRNLGTSTGEQVIFRGQDEFDASGDAFVGDWVTAGVQQFSFWFIHNAPANLTIGARFAKSPNFPGMSIPGPTNSVAPNTWTQMTVWIDPANPGWINEGAGATVAEGFANVFAAVGNIQVYAKRDASIPVDTTVTFGLDKVAASAVPEPGSLMLAAIGVVGALVGLRRRKTA